MPKTSNIQFFKTDDRQEFKKIFEDNYEHICRTIHRFIKDKNQVEDIAQTVFIKLWEKRDKIEIRTTLQAYLHRMAINEALMYLRKTKRNHEVEPDDNTIQASSPDAEKTYLQQELQSQITEAIDTLPPKTKVVFMLSRFEEMTYREIAEKMDISIKTVENQMGRALRILRETMKNYLSVFF